MFPEFINAGILTALLLYWIFGCLMIALTILVSILSKSMTVAAVSGFGCYALISSVAALPYVGKYTPGMLQVLSAELSGGTKLPSAAVIPALVTAAITAAAIFAGLAAFRRQEL